MSARQLLELIHERGGVATVKQGGAAPQIQITPRGLVSDLASDIQKFKPALLELLTPTAPSPQMAVEMPGSADFWRAAAQALESSRCGAHLAYTPELRRAWRAVNALENRDLNSRELCAMVRQKCEQE